MKYKYLTIFSNRIEFRGDQFRDQEETFKKGISISWVPIDVNSVQDYHFNIME